MTINKSSGDTLSFQNDIESEFGNNPDRRLGRYRRDDSANTIESFNKSPGSLSNLPLDTGIPTSGTIKFSDFYGKKLNMVVDYFTTAENREDVGASEMAATWRYNNSTAKVKVVGGFRGRPTGSLSGFNLSSGAWQGGKKVFININKNLGSAKISANGDRRKVALRTGSWPSNTTLQIDIGSSGRIQGAGGDGRQGATSSGKGGNGKPGSSGLGIEYAAQINISGSNKIRCGFGAGGAGGGSNSDPNKNPRDFGRSGGGGGGGAGIPFGNGGPENTGGYGSVGGNSPTSQKGVAGENGSANAGGNGGAGGAHGEGGGQAGSGRRGGDQNDAAQSGTAGDPNNGAGGDAGANGFGIVFSSTSVENNTTGSKNTAAAYGGDTVGSVL